MRGSYQCHLSRQLRHHILQPAVAIVEHPEEKQQAKGHKVQDKITSPGDAERSGCQRCDRRIRDGHRTGRPDDKPEQARQPARLPTAESPQIVEGGDGAKRYKNNLEQVHRITLSAIILTPIRNAADVFCPLARDASL